MLKYSFRFRDPIHGFINVNESERKIIDSEVFQRLRRIKQLAMSFYVYHGAKHTRFGHSLGAMHVVSRALDSLREKGKLDYNETEFDLLKQKARLAALLHDIGHPPFSHGSEKELFPNNLKHENYSIKIIEHYLSDIIDNAFSDIKAEDVISLLKKKVSKPEYFLRELIDGELDADKLDYLLRDSYYCGVRYGNYDLERILDTFTIFTHPNGVKQLAIESDGVHAVEGFIFARYWMFIQVYFHKTRRIFDYILTNSFKRLFNGHFPPLENIEEYIKYDDFVVWEEIKQKDDIWSQRLVKRNHLSSVFEKINPEGEGRVEFAWLKDELREQWGEENLFVDQAFNVETKYQLPNLETYEDFPPGKDLADQQVTLQSNKISLYPILVVDKHTNEPKSIKEESVPLKELRAVNILRIYTDKNKFQDASTTCKKTYEDIKIKTRKLGGPS
jgi:HD superfamily phosphohydrolase